MSDDDLRFPPAKRREPAEFKPPPWEREQFEELAKTRAEPGPEAVKEDEPPVSAPTTSVAEQVLAAVREVEGVRAKAGDAGEAGVKGPGESAIDPKRLEVMLMGLRAEEPRPQEAYWKVTTIAGGVSALIGFAIMTWAIIAFVAVSKAGPRGVTLASVLMLFGLGFAGGGVWLVAKTLREQGVL